MFGNGLNYVYLNLINASDLIPDKLFKSLTHQCDGYQAFLKGESLERGYKPDFVLKKAENSSSRKTFVGGMIKAAHFLQGNRTGVLVFVIVPKKNTTAKAISAHLAPYFNWISDKTNLRQIYVIEATHYCSGEQTLKIGSNSFKDVSLIVK